MLNILIIFSKKALIFLDQDTTILKKVCFQVKGSIIHEDKFLILYAIDPGHSELDAVSPGFIFIHT